jgi:hypothetical protein
VDCASDVNRIVTSWKPVKGMSTRPALYPLTCQGLACQLALPPCHGSRVTENISSRGFLIQCTKPRCSTAHYLLYMYVSMYTR